MREMALIALAPLAIACSFSGGSGDGDGDGDGDAGADASLCPELNLVVTANDDPVTIANNSIVNRITDVVEIDTAGSCGRQPLELTWSIPSDFSGDRGENGEPVVRVYMAVPGQSALTVTATDGTETVSVSLAVASVGLVQLPYAPANNDNIDGMAIAAGKLWFAAQNDGVYSLSLDDPYAAAGVGLFDREENLSGSIGRPRQLFADGDTVWVRNDDQRQRLYSFDATETDPSANEIQYADGANGNLEDMGYHPTGVRFSANNNLWIWDGATFTEELDDDAHAVAADDNEVWVGDDELHRLSDGATFDINQGEDDGLRAILIHGDEVWAGGGNGVGRIFNDEITRYSGVNGIRYFAADPSGDIWGVANGGIWRYQRARDQWHQIRGDTTGLENNNVKSLAIDTSHDQPVIYFGSDSSIHILTLEFPPPPSI